MLMLSGACSEHCSIVEDEISCDVVSCVRQVTGIDGNYRMTCESVMEVLRDHRDSVMAVLEAFVYDPLLNWRLMDGQSALLISLSNIVLNVQFFSLYIASNIVECSASGFRIKSSSTY